MSDLIFEVARIMQGEVDSLSNFAQNSANVNTPGYKTVRSAMDSASLFQLTNSSTGALSQSHGYDFSLGGISQTGLATNLAITGEGWFVLDTAEGERLTRNGSFSLDKDGMLVGAEGYPVKASGGGYVYVPDGNFDVTGAGYIVVDSEQIAQLQVVVPEDLLALKAEGSGLFSFNGRATEKETPNIVQGALEASNVDTSSEMVRIVEKTRYIETLQRAMSSYDELLNIGVNQIGQ